MTYVCLIEDNDWEGETWRFYIPVEGNEAAIEKIRATIDAAIAEAGPNPNADDEIPYRMSDRTYSESEVDLLCEDVERGYYDSHNKTEGAINLGSTFEVNDLYKFGLNRFGLLLVPSASEDEEEYDEEED